MQALLLRSFAVALVWAAAVALAGEVPGTALERLFTGVGEDEVLASGSDRQILEEVLARLDVPIASQVLVYSKTSAQNSRIAPETPRAIYFSDDFYVGWVQGGDIEVASFDAEDGMAFELVELTSRLHNRPPGIVREKACMNCHGGISGRETPVLLVRSVYPSSSGLPLYEAGTFHTRQSSPIAERWGGWYVTGQVDGQSHLGNALFQVDPESGEVNARVLADEAPATLDDLFSGEAYLHGAKSDVVALMVLEHQVGVHNALTEAYLSTRATLQRHASMRRAFDEPIDSPLSDTDARILDRLATRVLHEMLYVEEIEVPGGINGGGAFEEAFTKKRRKSAEGRSLRDFRLYERLMKHRCSHLIYSEFFDQLPDAVRDRILDQLHGILTEPNAWPDFAHLGNSERPQILAIVRETVPRLPASWK